MTVAESIRYLMDQRGWTVADLTRAAGVARSTIDNMFSRGTGTVSYTHLPGPACRAAEAVSCIAGG